MAKKNEYWNNYIISEFTPQWKNFITIGIGDFFVNLVMFLIKEALLKQYTSNKYHKFFLVFEVSIIA